MMERAIPTWELAIVDLASASLSWTAAKKLLVFFAPMPGKVLMAPLIVRHAPRALSL